jgi:ribosome maturation factor RimP
MAEINKLIEEITEQLGFTLIELDVNDKYKRINIVIHKKTGITTEDCTALSRELMDDLDYFERFGKNYGLEISSPGLDRKFKSFREYEIFKEQTVKVTSLQDGGHVETYTGILKGTDTDKNILIENEDELYKIPFLSIKKGGLYFGGEQ